MNGRLLAKTPNANAPGSWRELIQDPEGDFWDCYDGHQEHISRTQAVQLWEAHKIQEVTFSESFGDLKEFPDHDIEQEVFRRDLFRDGKQISFEKPLGDCTIQEIQTEIKRRIEQQTLDPGERIPFDLSPQEILGILRQDGDRTSHVLFLYASKDPEAYLDPVPDELLDKELSKRRIGGDS